MEESKWAWLARATCRRTAPHRMRCNRAPLPHRLAVPVRWSGVVRDTASGPVSCTVSHPLDIFSCVSISKSRTLESR
jgi:hypothetical protein